MPSPVDTAPWLTGVRLGRLCEVLTIVPSANAAAVPLRELTDALWRKCGGPMEEIPELCVLLDRVGLLKKASDSLVRTGAGDRVCRALRQGDRRELGFTLIRAGIFHEQARELVDAGKLGPSGELLCPVRAARVGAPQLVGLLGWWGEVTLVPRVVVPANLLQELNSIWALIPPSPEMPAWAAERKAVGNRAEMYSVEFERSKAADRSKIVWVARESDTLGWDIEDRSNAAVLRCVEVKGRRDASLEFYLSDNEWRKAESLGAQYELQFWGQIDLTKQAASEYGELRQAGYPVIICNLAAEIDAGGWKATPVRWKVAKA